ncbi:hypothetical protein CTEN210_02177 [Chaetoceros tenuissimus]|uniref:Plastid lipid-associated protein/fibrillin conserved domain-containing protein n=1 Tax=Chaetoceros tenuissimus TaxID=426638 RepID=A0AAD3CHG1_9STRA|nr:hypothetical protein CTEN210_02177 [Chaetoceros tenuissimus]
MRSSRILSKHILFSTIDDDSPSDYDPDSLLDPNLKDFTVDTNEEDESIRTELKRELLLLSSVSDRGLFLSTEEKSIVEDIVTQLEALNPTSETASQSYGVWDLVCTNTQAFRSSPFFQTIRSVLNDKTSADNAFNLHAAVTSVGKVGRVRQVIQENGKFTSEVDLEVGFLPVRVRVITNAFFEIIGAEQWELSIDSTIVKKSNIPLLDEMPNVPVGDFYNRVRGSIPTVYLKTYYVDDSVRITRDVDDNFYVFVRA